jgi:hypothetical protein
MSQGITAITSGTPITGATDVGADGFFEPARASIVAYKFAVIPLGGSRNAEPIPDGGGYMAARNFIDFTITHADYSGGTWEAIVETKVLDASITLTPKIRCISTPADTVVGSASNSTAGSDTVAWAQQVLSFTPVVGETYRLMFVKSADTFDAFGIGFMRRT